MTAPVTSRRHLRAVWEPLQAGLTALWLVYLTGHALWVALLWWVSVTPAYPLITVALDQLCLEFRCYREVRRLRRWPGFILPPEDPRESAGR